MLLYKVLYGDAPSGDAFLPFDIPHSLKKVSTTFVRSLPVWGIAGSTLGFSIVHTYETLMIAYCDLTMF